MYIYLTETKMASNLSFTLLPVTKLLLDRAKFDEMIYNYCILTQDYMF